MEQDKGASSADFAIEVMRLIAEYEWHDGEVFWHRFPRGGLPEVVCVLCNDLFFWGSADAERLTPGNIALLEQTAEQCQAIEPILGDIYAPLLFCCRVRQMRPQGAYYKHLPMKLHALFDACGPERKADFSNPVAQAGEAQRAATTGAACEHAVAEGHAPKTQQETNDD